MGTGTIRYRGRPANRNWIAVRVEVARGPALNMPFTIEHDLIGCVAEAARAKDRIALGIEIARGAAWLLLVLLTHHVDLTRVLGRVNC